MAAKPKLSPEQWAAVRSSWEGDEREGYAWLVEEMNLPVSAPGVRKTALREGWTKAGMPGKGGRAPAGGNEVPPRANKARKVSKVSENHQGKVSETISETMPGTIETLSETSRREVAVPKQVGRPVLYKPEYTEQAYRLCLLGLTDSELADFFGVTETTINNWKNDVPEFFESIKRGKIVADAKVSEALYHRAMGYSHPDVHIAVHQGEVIQTDIVKHYPPDTGAAFIWLKNRQARKWREKIEIKEDINLNVFPSKEVLDDIYRRTLAAAAERDSMLAGRRERLGIVIDDVEGRDVE